jgi:hypothetical protein
MISDMQTLQSTPLLNPEQEVWVPLIGNDNYAVSNLGNIKRTTWSKRRPLGGLLKPRTSRNGYLEVNIPIEGEWKNRKVSRLVAIHHLPSPTSEDQVFVNHKDGDRTNNRADNLEWSSREENNNHAQYALGNKRGTINSDQATQVRLMYNSGMSQRDIAKELGISKTQVGRIIRRQSWWRCEDKGVVQTFDKSKVVVEDPGPLEWRAVPSYPYLEVSNYGQVRDTLKKKVRKLNPNKDGRVKTHLEKGENGKRLIVLVHTIVAEAFLGPKPEGLEVNHKNAKDSDNRSTNLEYTTHGDNCRHRDGYTYRTGL